MVSGGSGWNPSLIEQSALTIRLETPRLIPHGGCFVRFPSQLLRWESLRSFLFMGDFSQEFCRVSVTLFRVISPQSRCFTGIDIQANLVKKFTDSHREAV